MTLIEAVARAIQRATATEERWQMPPYSKTAIDAFQQHFPGHTIGDKEGDRERRIALAAILATLEHLNANITPEMVAAGWGELKRARIPKLGPGPGVPECFRAMLDVAIQEVKK